MAYKQQQWVNLLTHVNLLSKAYAGLVWLWTLDQHRTNSWLLCRAYEQNDVAQRHFSTLSHQYSKHSANVVPTNDCYLEKNLGETYQCTI